MKPFPLRIRMGVAGHRVLPDDAALYKHITEVVKNNLEGWDEND